MTHGGSRPGAGRPRTASEPRTVSLHTLVTPAEADLIRAGAERAAETVSDVARRLLLRWARRR